MLPEGAHNMIRSVTIHHTNCIHGFSFLDKEGALLWEVGNTTEPDLDVKTVLIADNEVLVGVVAKLYPGYQYLYTDFQFQITSKPDFN